MSENRFQRFRRRRIRLPRWPGASPPALRSGRPWRSTSSCHHLLCLGWLQRLAQRGRVDIEPGENAECVNTLKKIELIAGHDLDTSTARVSNKFRFNGRVDSVEGPTLSGEHAGRECGATNAFHAEWRTIDETVSAVAGLLDRCRVTHGNGEPAQLAADLME